MGLIDGVFSLLFGGGRNVVKDTVEVFRTNAEAADQRDAAYRSAALSQFASEFAVPRQGPFDRFMDGLNRVPRPALAFGTIGLFVSAMVDPVWFASRMQGVALVPEPLWWLLGAIVSFYFGARHQIKGQEFQRSIAESVGRVAEVTSNMRMLDALDGGAAVAEDVGPIDETLADTNPALDDWRQTDAH